MRILSTPRRMRNTLSALLLSVPIAAFEVVISHRAPWWKLPYLPMAIWSTVMLAINLILVGLVSRASRWALPAVGSTGILWTLVSAWFAIRFHHYGVAFYTLFLALFWLLTYGAIARELSRAYINPRMRWYHGLPKPVPSLICTIKDGSFAAPLRVSRLNEDGVFLFGDYRQATAFGSWITARKDNVEFELHFRDRKVACRGRMISELDNRLGAGIQFIGMKPDDEKDLGDFVEILRGEGYV